MAESTQQYIARKLKQHRLDKRMTQAEVAQLAGLKDNTYAILERGERNLTLTNLHKICKALGIKASDVLPF